MAHTLRTGRRVGGGFFSCLLLIVFGLAGGASPAHAAPRIWIGADGGTWSTPTNWQPNGALADGDELVFNGSSSDNSVNDVAGPITFASLSFDKLHHITGNTISISGAGGIHVLAGAVTIAQDVEALADQTWTVDANAGLTVNGAIVLDGIEWIVTGGPSSLFVANGIISGTASFIKEGDVEVRLTQPNTFAGTVEIRQGEVQISYPTGLGVADGTPANGTSVSTSARLLLVDVTTFNEALTLNGTGTASNGALGVKNTGLGLTVDAPVTLSSPASVSADLGTLPNEITFNGAVTGGNVLQIVDTTVVVLESADNTVGAITFVGAQDGTLRLGAANVLQHTAAAIVLPAAATLDLQSYDVTLRALNGAGTVTTGGNVLQNLTFDIATAAAFTGTIGTGVVHLIKLGAAELTLGGANSHAGETRIQAGTLRVTHAGALGWDATGTYVSGTGTLTLDGVSIGVEPLHLTMAVPADNPQLRVSGMTPITLGGRLDVDGGGTIIGSPGSSLTMNGLIYAPGNLTITGVAVHAANASNTVLGTLSILNGGMYDVVADSPNMDGVTVAVAIGGTLALNGTSLRVARLVGNAGEVSLGTSGILEVSPSTPSLYDGSITGTGTLIKSGTSWLRLGGATTFTGAVNVTGGELIVAHAQAIGEPAITVAQGTGLTFASSNTHTGPLTAIGFGQGLASATVQVLGGNVTVSGLTTLGVAGAPATTLNVVAPHQLTFAGTVHGDLLYIQGEGTVVFGGTGSTLPHVYVGHATPPSIGGGTMRLGAANVFATMPGLDIASGATFDAGGFTTTLTYVAGSGRIHTGTASGSVTLAQLGLSFDGTFAGAGAIIIESGNNIFDIKGTHTLTGSLTANGPLRIVGSIADASVHVNDEVFSMEPGAVSGPLTFEHAGFSNIGNETSTNGVTTGSLTLHPEQTLGVYLSATSPRITARGTVTLAGSLAPFLVDGVPPGVFTIIDNDGTDPVVGTFEDLPEGSIRFFQNVGYRISYVGGTGNDVTLTPPLTSYHLSEGATGSFFDTDLLIANPSHDEVEVTVTFLPEGGMPIEETYFLDAMTRSTIRVKEIEGLESASFSTIVEPDIDVALVVERTMRWDASGYGAHTEKATTGPATTWYFAEGSEGFFRTFLLLANPHATANAAHVTWLREGATAVERTYALEPTSRRTIAALDDAELVNTSFGIKVTFDQPGVAERAMYFGMDPAFKGGHESAGATETSTTWFLAEGATGSGFDTFILVSNPDAEPADVTFTFLPESGSPASITRTVAGNSRITINPEAESLPIPEGPLATQVTATRPVIAERAQYWPLGPFEWTEAHNSFGVTAAATKWGLAEGRAGGPLGYQTYILLANPGTTDATVTLTFLEQFDNVPAPKTVVVPAQRRVNVFVEPVPTDDEEDAMEFGTLIVSDQPIVVERAMYWNVGGIVWAAGTNTTATRLP